MTARPPLPDGYTLPTDVNGWYHDPETGKNAHAWYSADRTACVGVFETLGRVYVKVTDERADGFERSVELYSDELPDAIYENRDWLRVALGFGADAAIAWMRSTAPAEWSHPEVCEAVFEAPPGYVLERYYMEERETVVYYRREGMESDVRMGELHEPEDYTPETCPYLYVHTWNGSGTATVALAPWLRAHGPGSQYPEIEPVADPPEECGLEVALTVARQWAREHVVDADADPVGQSDLSQFGGEIA